MEEIRINYTIDEMKDLARKDLQSKGYLVKWVFPHTKGIMVGVRHVTNLKGEDEVITIEGVDLA